MFRADPPPSRTLGLVATRACCLKSLHARRDHLARLGWHVELLTLDRAVAASSEARLLTLDCAGTPYAVPHVHGDGAPEQSDRLRLALEPLAFDVLEFPARDGLAFRAVQARRARLAFHATRLAVRLDHISELDRQRQGTWPDDLGELERDHAERYAFAHADLQIVTDPEVTAQAARLGWTVRPDALALTDDLPADVPPAPHTNASARVTVCVPYYNLPRYLPATLESLAQQTYPHLEVLVIDDGSTQPEARAVFDAMQARYPAFRFLRQDNAGIGATRNRGLREATGTYFLPMDADNVARRDLVERFVTAIEQRPDVVALTCYFLAFATDDDLQRGQFLHAYRATGGPHVLAGLRNVYGDATAIFRADAFRAVGGYETDRGTSFEDWEAFVKLVHAGGRIDVVPAHLFYYRHLPAGFSRTTSAFANRQRVLRQFAHLESLSLAERRALLDLLTGVQLRVEYLTARQRGLRYRLADRLHALAAAVPLAGPLLRWLTQPGTARPPAVRQGD